MHPHDHDTDRTSDSRALFLALLLIVGFMAVEVIVGVLAHSLALLADAAHMLTDAAAIGAGLFVARLALRPAGGAWTFGWKRAEVLSAQGNGITLLVAAVVIAVEAIRRLIHPDQVRGASLVAVASVGVVVNLLATRIVAGPSRHSINVEGVYRHLVTDLAAFTATIVAGIVVIATGYGRADAVAALFVVGLMLYAAGQLLAKTGRVLLEAAPEGMAPKVIVDDVLRDPRVASVHDVHLWLITSGFPALAAHVLVERTADCHAVRRDLETLLSERHGIDHTTLQVDHVAPHLLTIEPRPAR